MLADSRYEKSSEADIWDVTGHAAHVGALWEHSGTQQKQATKLADDEMPGVQPPGFSPHLSSCAVQEKHLPVLRVSAPGSHQTQGYELQEDSETALKRTDQARAPWRDALSRPGSATYGRAGPQLPLPPTRSLRGCLSLRAAGGSVTSSSPGTP